MPLPSAKEVAEAKLWPNGFVYRIAGNFTPEQDVPPEAIIGAWPVGPDGTISGDFVPNENYDPQRWPASFDDAE